MIVPRLRRSPTRTLMLKIDKFRGGSNTLINQARLDPKYAVESVNLVQDQDGIWRTRPGVNYYGEAIPGVSSIDGAWEYENSSGTREIIAIAGGYAWKSQDGGSWTQLSTTITFTAGETPYFLQIKDRLYISNGVDNLTYYDGTNLNRFTSLSAPGTPTGSLGAGLSSGSYNNYYRIVAANDVGYTTPSGSVNVATNTHRDYWSASDQYVDLSWTAVTGAKSYDIYWGEFDGEEVYIGSSTTNSFRDLGGDDYPPNPYVETPDDNTTAAPKFRTMEISNNRMWATYDDDNPYRVYYSGTGQYFAYFSPFYGGGYIDLEKGGRNKPVSVVHYRTGKGDPIITVLCKSADGRGTIFQISLTSITIGSTTFTVPVAYKLVGSIGADAPRAVAKVADNVFFLNKMGVYTLRNKQQMFNVLSTDDLSSPIRNKFESLNSSKLADSVAYYKPPRVYFSVPVGSENDKTVIFDVERGNWNWSWSIGFKQFFEYTENTGNNITRFLAVPTSGDRLVEISDNYLGDFGSAFYQSYISPLIPVHKDLTVAAKIREAIFELGKLRGAVTVEILGLSKDGQVTTLATKEITTTTGTTGIGDDLFSDFLFSDTGDEPSVFAESTTKKKVRVNKKMYALQFKVYSTNADTYFELLSLQAKGTFLPGRAPSAWN